MFDWKKSFALVLTSVLSASSTAVAEIAYKTNSDGSVSLEGNLPINRIAERSLKQGNVSIHGSTLELTDVGNDYSYSPVLLSGRIVKSAVTTSGGAVSIDGMIYFDGGVWLKDIDDPRAVEFAFYDGGFLRGRISGIVKDSVVMDCFGRKDELKLHEVTDLRSPRAYHFSIRNRSEMTVKTSMPPVRLAPMSINPRRGNEDDSLTELMNDPDLEGPSIFRPADAVRQIFRPPPRAAGIDF